MIDKVVGKIRAANVPIRKRVATSALAEVTRAPAALAAAKPTRPVIRAGLRPKRSDRLPAASTRPANARL